MIDTDYGNYALLYGCDRLWWTTLGLMVNKRVTYLSRDKFSDFPYIKAAKDYMRSIDLVYNTITSWVKTGKACNFDAAPTHEELMIQIFSRQPQWTDYEVMSYNT